MFDIDRAVDDWSRSVHSHRWNRAARIDELKDHLYCEIERLQKNGLTAEEAFKTATDRLGSIGALQNEHTKDEKTVSSLVKEAQEIEDYHLEQWRTAMSPKKAALLNIVISLFFGIAIVIADFLLDGTPHNHTVMYLLIAMWFVPFTFLSVTGWKGRKMAINN